MNNGHFMKCDAPNILSQLHHLGRSIAARSSGMQIDGRPMTNVEMQALLAWTDHQRYLEEQAMKLGNCFSGNYLKASDLGESPHTVTIARIQMENVGQSETDPEEKPVVYFDGRNKGLVLNKTNCGSLEAMFGTDETDELVGKEIVLYKTTTQFHGQTVPCIRIRTPDTQPAKPKDEIPF